MHILIWILFGILVGAASHILDSQEAQGGLIMAILMGVSGALFGGFIANAIFGLNLLSFDLSSFIIALCLSLFLVFIHRTALSKPL
jgi:uncharacterized membrane protein YeaQ/YmgE (transglycosylase-associated protein family)